MKNGKLKSPLRRYAMAAASCAFLIIGAGPSHSSKPAADTSSTGRAARHEVMLSPVTDQSGYESGTHSIGWRQVDATPESGRNPAADITLNELKGRLASLEKNAAKPDYFSKVTGAVAILISLVSLLFTTMTYLRDRPMLTVGFDKSAFFHPSDLADPKEPDWFTLTARLTNMGRRPIAITDVSFSALVGKDRIPGFRIDDALSGKEDPEISFQLLANDSKKASFSYGMSGLGRAKEFGMRWRKLPVEAEFEFVIQDASGKAFTQTFHLQDCMDIDLETARAYGRVSTGGEKEID